MDGKLTDKPIEIGTFEELRSVLLEAFPEGNMSREELFNGLGITMPLERNIIIGQLGPWSDRYTVDEVADLFWRRSNYADDEGEAESSKPSLARRRPGGQATHSPRRGICDQARPLACADPAKPDPRLIALTDRMADAIKEVREEILASSGDDDAGRDLAELLGAWHQYKKERGV